VNCASAATITVSEGESIQSAINQAAPGDTIEVESGNYSGLVSVTKRLSLVGVDTGKGRPVLDAGGSGSPITLWVPGSSIQGFEVRNSGLSELEAGIKVSAGNITVKDNVIKSCNLGIRLQISDESTVEGNSLENNQRGIILFQSNQNEIKANSLGNNVYGVFIWDSSGNQVANNEIWTCQETGIYVVSSHENCLSRNKLARNGVGVLITSSENNIVLDNDFYNNSEQGIHIKESGGNVLKKNRLQADVSGLYVEGKDYSDFKNDVDSSNEVGGKPVCYLVDARDAVVDASSNAGMVICIRCQNVTIEGLTTEGNDIGIYLYQTEGATIRNNTAKNNKQYGIELVESGDNVLYCNSASMNKEGIHLENSTLNIVKGNNVYNNTAGITLSDDSIYNAAYLNNLFYNGNYNAVDEGTNLWYVGSYGNFYDDANSTDTDGDGICDNPHTISGGDMVDMYPRSSLVGFPEQLKAPLAKLRINDNATEQSTGAQEKSQAEDQMKSQAEDQLVTQSDDQMESCPYGPGTCT
jgi:parallel beta-helix repeat protein